MFALIQTLIELNIIHRPAQIFCDNKAAIDIVKTKRDCEGMKDIHLESLKLREHYRCGVMTLEYVKSIKGVADIFTKNLPFPQFATLREQLLFYSDSYNK